MAMPWEILKSLSDPTRLRVLQLLALEELSVAELQQILEMGQSRISSHLALLRGAELVIDRKAGKHSYYGRNPHLTPESEGILEAALAATRGEPAFQRDREELGRVLEERRQIARRYFDEIAGRLGKHHCPGRSWQAFGHMLLQLVPKIEIADLGAGEGTVSHLLARRAKTVYCIDNSPAMVEVGTRLAQEHDLPNVHYKLGDIESVPLPAESVDVALLSQALHHAQHPPAAIAEAFRILRPGGQVILLDLKEHRFEQARELYADTWLGFRESTLRDMLRDAGFQQTEVRIVSRETREPHFETLFASGWKPA